MNEELNVYAESENAKLNFFNNRKSNDNVKIRALFIVSRDEFKSFSAYSKSEGFRIPEEAVSKYVIKLITAKSNDYRISNNEDRIRTYGTYVDEIRNYAVYLIMSHLIVLAVGVAINYLMESESKHYIITVILYAFSLSFAIFAWFLALIRHLYRLDHSNRHAIRILPAMIKISSYMEYCLILSLVIFLLSILTRVILLTLHFS